MARKSEKADALDKHIGARIRQQRENLGMTQGELAHATGVSYQQVHKYESGFNRISAGRLGLIAQTLRFSVQQFYEGFSGHDSNELSEAECSPLCLEVARNFGRVRNARYQEAVRMLVRTLADQSENAMA